MNNKDHEVIIETEECDVRGRVQRKSRRSSGMRFSRARSSGKMPLMRWQRRGAAKECALYAIKQGVRASFPAMQNELLDKYLAW